MKKNLFLALFLSSFPYKVFACGGGERLIGGSWMDSFWVSLLTWFTIFGILFGSICFVFGLLLYIVQYFVKNKNNKIFKTKKKLVAWSLLVFILSLIIFILIKANQSMLCGSGNF